MADKYILRVTAGSDYNIDHHVVVPVNAPETVRVSTDLIDAELNVRVRNYRGLPRGSPASSPYFELEPHAANEDQYSIAIRFTPKRPPRRKSPAPRGGAADASGAGDEGPLQGADPAPSLTPAGKDDGDEDGSGEEGGKEAEQARGISGRDLQFGNDFDHPIRDRLPPGFSYAMNIVKWWIDPGLDGDPYADAPYLYGPGLSSFSAVHVGAGAFNPENGGLCFDEGGDEDGLRERRGVGAPDGAKERKKWALADGSKGGWVWEFGRTYCVDFCNPYLDFGEFALRLPGFTLPIMKYWDGQGLRAHRKRSHTLRYVLRNRTTGETYLTVLFSLYLKEDVNEDGSLKPAALEAKREDLELARQAGKITNGDVGGDGGGDEKGEAPAESAGGGDDDDVD
ncbi:hypothetical protein F4825DRAFT_414120 [Nemania diffusa]|nr:hypothetical protein F4825DRAFT_414120 [Nemania diffusa]